MPLLLRAIDRAQERGIGRWTGWSGGRTGGEISRSSEQANLRGGMVIGLVFVGFGLFVAIPAIGIPGVVWTVLAAVITVTNAVNLVSKTGIADTEIVSDDDRVSGAALLPFDERLRRLEQLQKDGLVSDEEFQRKRAELLSERW